MSEDKEKLDDEDIDLFAVLAALDRKDYDYYDRLTPAQQKKIIPYMLVQWMSAVKGNADVQNYYLQSTDIQANKYLVDPTISSKHKLQWLMLCTISPNVGKMFHQWIPHVKESVINLTSNTTAKEIATFYKKIYPKLSDADVAEYSKEYVKQHKRKMYLAKNFPTMKLDEIELLNELISDDDIEAYERANGNT